MDTEVWERAQDRAVTVDRSETRVVRAVVLGSALVIGLAVLVDQLGLTRPALSLSGSGGGTADTETRRGAIGLEVSSRSLLGEELSSVDVDYPGLTVTAARFDPPTLRFGESGMLFLEVLVDCEARSTDGAPAWSEEATTFASPDLTLRTHRPWGTAGRTVQGAGGTVVSTAGLACLPP